jgi:hypothetical protein
VATDAATAADAISATNPYTVAFLLHPRRSQIQTTNNEELSKRSGEKKKKKTSISPSIPKTTAIFFSHNTTNIFSLFTSCSSSLCFLSAIKIAHQINQETPKKNNENQSKIQREKEKEKRMQNSSYLISAAPNFPLKIVTRGHELVMMQSLPHLDCKRTRLLRHKRKRRIQSR